jgi:hypothetical protein
MDHLLPLTRSRPFEEYPPDAGMDPLFGELEPLARDPFEVTLAELGDRGPRVPMELIVTREDVPRAFAVAFELGSGLEEFEITVRRRKG